MSRKLSIVSFSAILLLALLLRLYRLANNPRILNRDEAALAYNAYLIKETGQDEWEESYPLVFKSFGDYKLPGYVYLLATLFNIFEPSDWLVRLPSALAGVGVVVMCFLIGRKSFKSPSQAYVLMLISAVTPIFIFYSRMAWEANLGLLLLLVSMYLLLFRDLNNNQSYKKDLIGLICYLFAILTYNTPLLLLPVVMCVLILQRGCKEWRLWIFPVMGLLMIAMSGYLMLNSVTAQKSAITIFSDPTTWQNYVKYRGSLPAMTQMIFGSQYIFWLILLIKNIFASFSPQFLVIRGGTHPWHAIPQSAHLYWSIYGLGLLGVWTAFVRLIFDLFQRKKITENQDWLWLLLLLGSLLPAVITIDAPHATRSLLFMIIFCVMAMKGLSFLVQITKLRAELILFLFFGVLALESSIYVNRYFFSFPQQQQALKPGFDLLLAMTDQKLQSTVIEVEADGYQYILQAWYQRLSPDLFFKSLSRVGPDPVGLYRVEKLNNIRYVNQLGADEKGILQVYWSDSDSIWVIKEKEEL